MTDQDRIKLWEELRQSPQLMEKIQSWEGSEIRCQQELRQTYAPELVRLALELSELRSKAATRFSQSESMWFTRQSLEQASSEELARYKAQRWQELLPTGTHIYDLCTGVGMDAIALAEVGHVETVDRSLEISQLAEWNAEAYGVREKIDFKQGEAESIPLENSYVHLDPDQRDATGRRQRRLEHVSPALEFLQQVVERARGACIKLSPASNFGGKFPDAEVELVSLNGECKQALIWSGELAEPGMWRATSLPTGETIIADPLDAWVEMSEVDHFVYDPDPALVRSGLVNCLAESLGLSRLDDAEEYLTSSTAVSSPFLSRFRVHEVLPRNPKGIKKYLRDHELGQLELKCRHLPLDLEKMRKTLQVPGTESATIIFAKVAGKTRSLICERELN